MNTNEKLSAIFIKQMTLDNDRLTIASIDILVFDSSFNFLLFENVAQSFQSLQMLLI